MKYCGYMIYMRYIDFGSILLITTIIE